MAEKSMLAYFKSPDKAQLAAKELESIGIKEMRIDRIHKYPGDGIDKRMNPLTGQISSLAGLTLGLDDDGPAVRTLMAADVSASGMSDDGDEVVSGHNILLTAVVDEEVYDHALQRVRAIGGLV